jgi:hypothetical protein
MRSHVAALSQQRRPNRPGAKPGPHRALVKNPGPEGPGNAAQAAQEETGFKRFHPRRVRPLR